MSYRSNSWSPEAARFKSIYNHSEIWEAPRQERCRDVCQISERYDHHNIQFDGFETSRFGGKTSVRLVNRGPEAFWMVYMYHLFVQDKHIWDNIFINMSFYQQRN